MLMSCTSDLETLKKENVGADDVCVLDPQNRHWTRWSGYRSIANLLFILSTVISR